PAAVRHPPRGDRAAAGMGAGSDPPRLPPATRAPERGGAVSRLRRFRHLGGARPRRDDAEARTRLGRFAAVGAPAAALACARCGDPLPDADASCPRCATDDAPAPEASGRTERFRTLAGTGSIPLAREVAPRATGSEV